MKNRHHIFSAVLLGVLAVAAFAPAASADHDRGDRGDRRSDSRDSRSWRGSRDSRSYGGWGDRWARGGERRSYYYEDPYCGERSQYISDFKDHYARAGHGPLIVKIDIHSGDVLAQYRYDYRAEEWRSCDREDRRSGRGSYGDRSGYGERGSCGRGSSDRESAERRNEDRD